MEPMNLLSKETAKDSYAKIEARICNGFTPEIDDLTEFRRILESVYSEICNEVDEPLSNTYARMGYVHDVHSVPREYVNEFHSLRKYVNDFAHKWPEVEDRKYFASVKVISLAVNFFSGVPIPVSIENFYDIGGELTLVSPDRPKYETISFDRATIIRIEFPGEAHRGRKCFLTCESEGELGKYIIEFKDSWLKENGKTRWPFGYNHSVIGQLVWKYATVHFFNISKDQNRDNYFHSNQNTRVVIEPDYLISASTVAKAYFDSQEGHFQRNSLIPILRPFFGVEPKGPLFMGTVANDLLDEAIKSGKIDYDERFDQTQNSQVWNSIHLGEAELEKLRGIGKTLHLPNFSPLELNLKGRRTLIEPSFYSPEFGLEGRLDALMECVKDPLRKDILELKSGKSKHPSMVASEHKMQVVAYNLILKSVFGKSRKGKSSVMYSQATENPIREIPYNFLEEQKVLMIRNYMVGCWMNIARRDFRTFEKIKSIQTPKAPPYKKSEFFRFQKAYKNCSPIHRSYFNEFVAFVIRELQTAKIGDTNPKDGKASGFSSFWRDNMEDKRLNHKLLGNLKFKNAIPESSWQEMEFELDENGLFSSDFRERDHILLYPEDAESPVKCQILKGSISKMEPGKIVLRLNNPQIDANHFESHGSWAIEHNIMEKGYEAQLESMFSFLESEPTKRELILGAKKPRFSAKNMPLDLDLMEVDPKSSQSKAIKASLSAKDYTLIQGPPGTGKTSRVLLYTLLHILRHTDETVFLLAFTNRAVHKIIEAIEDYNEQTKQLNVDFIRLASSSDSGPRTLKNISESMSIAEAERVVLKTRVFIGTLNTYQKRRNQFPKGVARDTLIVDEASQLTEPQLAGILPGFERFILIGDHNQLPAVITQREVKCRARDENLMGLGINDLRTSLFERLWKNAKSKGWGEATVTLQEHFRMHKEIAELINPYYNMQLTPNIERQFAALPTANSEDELTNLILSNRVVFIESPRGEGKYHPGEAERVLKLVSAIAKSEGKTFDKDKSVGVIAPWRAQINTIKQKLAGKPKLKNVLVDTIERFQGSERRNIILSLSASNKNQLDRLESEYENEFGVDVDRKLNVALSRAEERLIILGEPETLIQSEHYRRLLHSIQDRGCFIDLDTANQLFGQASK